VVVDVVVIVVVVDAGWVVVVVPDAGQVYFWLLSLKVQAWPQSASHNPL